MSSLQLLLLGGFQARAGGHEADIPGRKERALLAFLAIPPGEPRSRDKLAGLLWSDRADSQARDSLKQAVFKLRKALDGVRPPPIRVDREFVSLDQTAVAVDVVEFEQLIGAGTPEAVARATTLYRGDLLDGLDVRDSVFDEWLLMERQRLRDLARDGLASLLDQHLASGARDQAAAVARRLLGLDPLREVAHRALMHVYAEQGQTALALKQYQLCRDALQSELGVRPEAETERLYRSIQEKRTGARRTFTQTPTVEQSSTPRSEFEEPQSENDPPASHTAVKPSIAVLPFVNLSGDPEQEYFADGIVEDIISGLTRLHWLFVIARDSSFVFKGKAIDVKQVGRELGVRYLLEGSVRKAGDRIRIASELVDTAAGAHIWADHFDGALRDIFDLQDRITASVVGAIEPKLRSAEIERARRKRTESVDAYDLFLRAVALNNTRKKEDNQEALRLLYRAIEIDPRYAAAYALAGYCYLRQWAQLWVSSSDPAVAEGVRMARLAAEYGQHDPEALWMAGVTISIAGSDADGGLALIDRSLALNPNSANALMVSGLVRAFSGKGDAAMADLERSRRLSPLDPIAYGTSLGFAWAHFMAGRYAEAAASCDRTLYEAPTHYPPALAMKIVCCGLLGRLEEGRKGVQRLLAVNPEVTLSSMQAWFRLMIKQPDVLDTLLDGLRKAGVPSARAPSSSGSHLPSKPSIAVLPFVNLSADPEQEFFVDGLTEDIITALSRISALWVIARGSTFTYKGKPTDVKRVAQELGVRYVMEGSVRRAGDRLRVTAQLIDAATGHDVWAERYDRPLADLFDIQDEITRSVAASTETQVVLAERQAAESRPSSDFRARDLVARAWARMYDQTPESIAEASDLVEEAIRIDPSNPTAHRVRAAIFLHRFWIGETLHDAADVARAFELARTALRLAPRDEYAHLAMAWAWAYAAGQLEDAIAECERGLEINPNCSLVLGNLGYYLAALGRTQEAIEACRLSLQLNPRDPSNFWRHQAIATAHFVAADYAASLEESKRIARSRPHLPSAIIWAASAAALDKADEARTALGYCLAQRPDLHVGGVVPRIMLRFARDEDHERLLELLRKAGLPE